MRCERALLLPADTNKQRIKNLWEQLVFMEQQAKPKATRGYFFLLPYFHSVKRASLHHGTPRKEAAPATSGPEDGAEVVTASWVTTTRWGWWGIR